tara:strand:- start:12380 stop:14320 length:1941 start_codon:yes stop_codon:yes gene_type:complete
MKNYKKIKNKFPFLQLLNFTLKSYENLDRYSKTFFLIVLDIFAIIFSFIFINFLSINNLIFNENQIEFNFIILLSIGLIINYLTGQYKTITRYIRILDIYIIGLGNLATLLFTFLLTQSIFISKPNLKIYLLFWMILTLSNIITKSTLNLFISYLRKNNINKTYKVAIYGAGQAGAQLASSLILTGSHKIIAFFDDSPKLLNRTLLGIPIFSPKDIFSLKKDLDQILLAIPSISKKKSQEIIKLIQQYEIPIMKVPSIESLASGKSKIDSLKPIEIEDLLGRIVVKPSKKLMERSTLNLNICVTGAGGSIGKELSKQILNVGPSLLLLVDSSEPALYHLEQNLIESFGSNSRTKVVPILGNVNDYQFTKFLFKKYQINTVFHAAAYKHVPLIEKNPIQGIYNNVFSTLNICRAAENSGVGKLTLISTDKAVRPSNVMGASKRLAEMILQAFAENYNMYLDKNISKNYVEFSIVRFGNVLASSGSVVPLFKKQIENGGPLTLTNKKVIRYFMTIKEASQLVLQASSIAEGGDVLLLDMGDPIKIYDLAKQMIRLSGRTVKDEKNPKGDIEIKVIGLRPGEKMYEELLIDAKAESTVHPLIYKAKEKFIPLNELLTKLDLLEKSINNFDLEETLNIISDLVPEWNRSG